MRRRHRYEEEIRIDLRPLIDILFVLLTYFLFSLVMMMRVNVLPINLATVGSGGAGSGQDSLQAVTIDRAGRYFLNREPLEPADLVARLQQIAAEPNPPRLYVGIEQESSLDRAPLLLKLMELIHTAGLTNVAFVGPPPSEIGRVEPASPAVSTP